MERKTKIVIVFCPVCGKKEKLYIEPRKTKNGLIRRTIKHRDHTLIIDFDETLTVRGAYIWKKTINKKN